MAIAIVSEHQILTDIFIPLHDENMCFLYNYKHSLIAPPLSVKPQLSICQKTPLICSIILKPLDRFSPNLMKMCILKRSIPHEVLGMIQ